MARSFSAGTQKLVDQAERSEQARRTRKRQSAVVVTSQRWTEAQRKREAKAAGKTRIELLKYNLKQARDQSRKETARLRSRYKTSRIPLQAQIKRFRQKWRDWVNAQVAEYRRKHREVWRGRIDAARLAVIKAELELKAERGYQADYRKIDRQQKALRKAQPRAKQTGRLHRAESDDAVERNLPDDLIPIWRKVKNRIRTAHTHKTRTEAFLEWVHENSDEVEAIRSRIDAAAQRTIGREMAEAERRLYAEGYYDADVPF